MSESSERLRPTESTQSSFQTTNNSQRLRPTAAGASSYEQIVQQSPLSRVIPSRSPSPQVSNQEMVARILESCAKKLFEREYLILLPFRPVLFVRPHQEEMESLSGKPHFCGEFVFRQFSFFLWIPWLAPRNPRIFEFQASKIRVPARNPCHFA